MDLLSSADALWRAATYLSVAQLHLRANPLSTRPFRLCEVKQRPSGHWGTVPGIAWALAHVGLAAGRCPDEEIIPVIGAGHAGIVQRALAWMTGDLGKADSRFGRDIAGLTALVASFPDGYGLGSEVHPALPAGAYMGGWLGGALAFAQGMALDEPSRVVIPIVGDGECETPTTAASWLAQRAIPAARVLPVVHLNGHRMGGPSLLGAMNDGQLVAYACGLGWEPAIAHVGTGSLAEHAAFHEALVDGIDAARRGERRLVFLRCVKGWSGPIGAHKTPLTDLATNPHQRLQLREWMSSYQPHELFGDDAQPAGVLASALNEIRLCRPQPAEPPVIPAAAPTGRGFSTEVAAVLGAHAASGDFKIFSPDELRSNRLGDLAGEPWVHEVLAEEVLLGWLAGWIASGRRGVLISYEAFAPLLLTGLVGHLKQRRLVNVRLPSINLLLTSYGWHNVYTHGDPSLVTALLGTGDPAVHVFTPADADRAALALDDALRSTGQVNVIIAGKHSTPSHPSETMDCERRHGLAIWNHLSDPGEPDLTLVCAGDLAAAIVSEAVEPIRERHRCRLRVVNVHDLASLAGPAIGRCIREQTPVLVVTLGHPAAIRGLLAGRVRDLDVVGWREPPHPMSQDGVAAYAGLDLAGITRAAAALLANRGR
ncbi:hypothetical protein CSH63_23850 [Micromonospora tulbaghiae]|uniref:Xylulose-5-phosphate/fructose-6-phosphate phosphoketolase n=1 Tax=Micromonospora tulbaghiae TaxID=479978 RepID=A0A386WPR7_9ACTN|nr:hypothetical protein [Micromonospora tulbaghiae]AYF30426.1 hypothetical protein CSH63_23850 [Micromonospora tulbaghiae]